MDLALASAVLDLVVFKGLFIRGSITFSDLCLGLFLVLEAYFCPTCFIDFYGKSSSFFNKSCHVKGKLEKSFCLPC